MRSEVAAEKRSKEEKEDSAGARGRSLCEDDNVRKAEWVTRGHDALDRAGT